MKPTLTLLLVAALAFTTVAAQRQRGSSERIQFESGQNSLTFSGSVKGDNVMDYVLPAKAGQKVQIKMTPGNNSLYFNVLPPGSDNEAMFIGSVGGQETSRILPVSGNYRIRVYLYRANDNVTGKFQMTVRLTGTGLVPASGASDAKTGGYHARADVPFQYTYNKGIKSAKGGVIRYRTAGSATVDLRWDRGGRRRILFMNGKPVAADSSESLTFERSGDDTIVRLGDDPTEQFVIPDAFVFGG